MEARWASPVTILRFQLNSSGKTLGQEANVVLPSKTWLHHSSETEQQLITILL